jgi:predicted small integral membrane protein
VCRTIRMDTKLPGSMCHRFEVLAPNLLNLWQSGRAGLMPCLGSICHRFAFIGCMKPLTRQYLSPFCFHRLHEAPYQAVSVTVLLWSVASALPGRIRRRFSSRETRSWIRFSVVTVAVSAKRQCSPSLLGSICHRFFVRRMDRA